MNKLKRDGQSFPMDLFMKSKEQQNALSLLCFRWVDLELLPPAEEKVLGEEGTHQDGVSDL